MVGSQSISALKTGTLGQITILPLQFLHLQDNRGQLAPCFSPAHTNTCTGRV